MTVRRRIYDHYSVEDCTDSPHHFIAEYDPGDVAEDDPPPLLVDREDLWERLQRAQAELAAAETAIREAWQVGVPLDEVEREVGLALWHRLHRHRDYSMEEWDALVERLLVHMGHDPERHYRFRGRKKSGA